MKLFKCRTLPSLPRSQPFFGCRATLRGALRDIQKTAARETRLCLNETSFIEDDHLRLVQIALN